MIADFYPGDEDLWVVDAQGNWVIAKLPLREVTHKGADASLHRLRLRRREKWQGKSWGWTAKARWIER